MQNIGQLKKLAETAFDQDRMASAVELLRCYLEAFPTDGKAWMLYGDALRITGRKGKAAVALSEAEKHCPPEYKWTVHARLGLLFQDAGDLATSGRWYAKALEAEEARGESWVWVLRGTTFAAQELFQEAEECYRNAIAVNARDEEAHLNLASILVATERYDEAIVAAQTAIEICPDYPGALKMLKSLEGANESRALAASLRRCRDR